MSDFLRNEMQSLDEVKSQIERSTASVPFRDLFNHEPLLKFVHAEKERFLVAFQEDRVILRGDDQGETGGWKVHKDQPDDPYHPKYWTPFKIKAIWIPIEKGTLFQADNASSSCPLVRSAQQGQKEFLFFIHPSSEAFYQNLLSQYPALEFDALSLSSFRSLLIALPDAKKSGAFQPVLIKISLDKQIGHVNRLLQEKECAMSVATSELLPHIMNRANINLTLIRDPLAFIPDGFEHGMLYRVVPPILHPACDNPQGMYMVPLYALLSAKNLPFLEHIIEQNGGNTTQVLQDCIISPFAKIVTTLLHQTHTSIEAHGQNLLLILDKDDKIINLAYRDMGGVNMLLSKTELASLSDKKLQKKEWFYFNTHVQDSASTFESHFIHRFLFSLTKQLVKSEKLSLHDPVLKQWIALMKSDNYLQNWTIPDQQDNDKHLEKIPEQDFFRYGYVERLFFMTYLRCLQDNMWISPELVQQFIAQFTQPEYVTGQLLAPCTYVTFFNRSIEQSYHVETDENGLRLGT